MKREVHSYPSNNKIYKIHDMCTQILKNIESALNCSFHISFHSVFFHVGSRRQPP